MAVSSILHQFHPAVQKWFGERFGAPSRVQELGWPVIGETHNGIGHDVLLCAPTGSGKTLAAFMWAINRLVIEAEQRVLTDQISVLYVSPLKALANDVRINLEEPLAGVRSVAVANGLELGTIRAGLRTGDTPAGERAAMLRRPPQILVTTPESLFILLTSTRFRQKLRAVRYVIVDELHAIAGNKRGAHLMLTLERLDRLVSHNDSPRPTRIGLSATLNPIATLAAFLAGAEVADDRTRTPRPVRVVRAQEEPRQLDLQIIAPGPELGSLATHQHWEAMYDALAVLIREHRTTLVFTLSRRWAERIALALQKRVGAGAVVAHHGSLARLERLQAEQRLKRGELKAIVATSSLELGIDVGAVDLVCQVDSPRSIAAAVQRIGRSGHHLGGVPKGRFFSLTIDDLLESAAAVRAIRQGHLDEVEIPAGCMDVAAQQIIAIAADEEQIGESELLKILCSVQNFAGLTLSELRQLLAEMAAQLPERIQGASPKIFYDQVNGLVRARRGARLAAITSGGTIPESGNLDVVIASEGRKIGDIEEDFAQESSRGDIFSLGSMPWRVLGISKNRFLVEAAPGMAPSLPFWQTEAGGRSPALSTELCDLRRRIASFITNSSTDDDACSWLESECALEPRAASQTVAYVRRGLAALNALPDERTLVVERFFDGLGGTQIVIHSPWGIRLNRGLGLALRKRLCQSFDFEIQASAIDDSILLALNSRHSFPLEHLLSMVSSRNVRSVLEQALLDAPMFEVRFRHVATRALSIMRSARGSKVPAWIQRLRTQELITALFPQRNACLDNRPAAVILPEHFVVRETMRECLDETADIARLEVLLRGLEDGSIRPVMVDSIAPSVFAHRVLLAWDYSFLDDGERANRRSRTVTMNRAMAEDVFRSENLAEMLSENAVERVVEEIQGRTTSTRARNCDELYELVRTHGSLALGEMDQRTTADAAAMLSLLENQGRIRRVRLGRGESVELAIAAEDLLLFSAAYSDLKVSGHFENRVDWPIAIAPVSGHLEGREVQSAEQLGRGFERDAAIEEIVRRALVTSGPALEVDLAQRLRLPIGAITTALVSLESKGSIFRGHFTPECSANSVALSSQAADENIRPSDHVDADIPPRGQGEVRRVSLSRAVATDRSQARQNETQWCDRFVLERIHRQTLNLLRSSVEPCNDAEFVAFRLKWNGITEASSHTGIDSVRRVLEQMNGLAFAPELWERAILPARVVDYRPEHLDLLCMSGEFAWVASAFHNEFEAQRDFPAAVAFLPRRGRSYWPAGEVPADSNAQKVIEVLTKFGAQYLDQVAERVNLSERDTLAGLWQLAAAGLVSNDSFAPLRLVAIEPDAARLIANRHSRSVDRKSTRRDAALRARLQTSLSGRWSIVHPLASSEIAETHDAHGSDHAREVALILLRRHGILAREMMALEQVETPWQQILFALRRLEYAGTIRRGWFVRALSGEQYALPEALEMLRAERQPHEPGLPLVLSAADPANPFGVLLPGSGVAREADNLLVVQGGRVLAGLAGRALTCSPDGDEASFKANITQLMKLRPRLVLDTINGEPALESAHVTAMAAMGFHSDGRALVYDGLPGPAPRRAIASHAQP